MYHSRKRSNPISGYLLLTLTCLLSATAGADTLVVKAPVTEAVLFPQQARVTRGAAQKLPAGRHQLFVRDLPELDLDALQVQVRGARLLGVRESEASEPEDVSRSRRQLEQEIADLEQALKAAEAEDALDRQQIERMLSLLGQSGEGPGFYAQLPVSEWPEAWAQIRGEVDRRQAAINQRHRKRRAQERELESLRQQHKRLGQVQRRRGQLLVEVQAAQAVQAELVLRYFTGMAYWENQLDFDLDTSAEEVSVSSLALIHNRTGEDWRGVALTLGLIPAGYRQLQEPSPWVVDLATRQRKASLRMEVAQPEPVAPLEEVTVTGIRAAAPQAHGLDMRIPLEAMDIPSDGSHARVPYQRSTLPATLSRESYLWQQPTVLLVGEWQNSGELPWLPGEVTVMRDGQRLASHYRDDVVETGESLRVSFGDDPRLQVEIARQPSSRGKTGLINRETTLTTLQKITFTSSYDKPVSVDIFDRLPVAADDSITVAARGEAADETDVRDVKGLRRWRRQVQPGNSITLDAGYEIRYPRDQKLSGIN